MQKQTTSVGLLVFIQPKTIIVSLKRTSSLMKMWFNYSYTLWFFSDCTLLTMSNSAVT